MSSLHLGLPGGSARSTGEDDGGALYLHERGVARLCMCEIESSNCTRDGGAICSPGDLEMRHCSIGNCTAGHFRGAIAMRPGSRGILADCSISGARSASAAIGTEGNDALLDTYQ